MPGPQRSDAHGAALPVSAQVGCGWLTGAQNRAIFAPEVPARDRGWLNNRRDTPVWFSRQGDDGAGSAAVRVPCPKAAIARTGGRQSPFRCRRVEHKRAVLPGEAAPGAPTAAGELARPHIVATSAAVIDPDLPD